MKQIREEDMTTGQRCEKYLPYVKEAMELIFKDEISVKMEFLDDYTITIDGWIELTPVVAVPPSRTITSHGKTHIISYTEERPMWQINIVTYIPQTRWEPEDSDVDEHGVFDYHTAMQEIFRLLVGKMYSNLQEYKAAEQYVIEEDLTEADIAAFNKMKEENESN